MIADDVRARLNPAGLPSPVQLGRRFKREQMATLFSDYGCRVGAEVGVCTGLFSETLCQRIPALERLFCVDPWASFDGNRPNGWGRNQQVHDANYAEAVQRLAAYPAAEIVRLPSLDAAHELEPGLQLDFVYIDGNHRFDFVMQDLIAWSDRVRPGGIVAGDDYYPFHGKGYVERGVMLAVDAYAAAHGIADVYVASNRSRSWFWVKPL